MSNFDKYPKSLVDYAKLYGLLMDNNVADELSVNLELLLEIIPEIEPMIGFDQKHPHHHLDLWQHTLYALSMSEKDMTTRLTLLLHDIGKPHFYIEEDGVRHYPNHGKVSSIIAKSILERFELNEEYINKICYLIENHDRPITDEDIIQDYDLSYTLLHIQECDALAHNPDKLEKRIKYLNNTDEKLKRMAK